ncbi:MAG: YkoF family thiamine/hydroxymethylpyrimidine-binding protein [Steroidobacterales bacterium]
MEIGVEISLYPLAEHFVPEIHDFIARISAVGELKVVTGSFSTQIFGEYERVFETLRRELRATFDSRAEQGGKAAFVLKVLGPL